MDTIQKPKARRTVKRGNNEGSITQLADGRWQARISMDGRRKAFYGATRAEAAAKLNAALRDRGLPVFEERQTVAQYVASWLETIRPAVRPSTWKRYRDLLTLHALPTLGKSPPARLGPQQVQVLYACKLEEGLSPTTVRSRSDEGRREGWAGEDRREGGQERLALLAQGREIPAQTRERASSRRAAEAARDVLRHLEPAQVAFSLGIVEREGQVVEEQASTCSWPTARRSGTLRAGRRGAAGGGLAASPAASGSR